MPFEGRKLIIGSVAVAAVIGCAAFFFFELAPASRADNAPSVIFNIQSGEKSRAIVGGLAGQGLIRSAFATEIIALLNGSALHMQPGLYKLSPSMSSWEILGVLSGRVADEVTVTIPEGSNIYQIDGALANALVIKRGDLIDFNIQSSNEFEGRLFPDTYRFFTGTPVASVAQKLLDNFNAKAGPILAPDIKNATSDIVVASLIEKEVSDPTDQKIVAGIIYKRLKQGIALDLDATVCYIKYQRAPTSTAGCLPLASVDYKVKSAYNTYLYQGLPPGPIGNPGISAIQAAIAPQASPYLYYLTDPATGKTIFAKTLDEQNANRVKYLKAN
jgi:UPF0755 protein